MSMLTELKARIISSMKTKNIVERDLFRLIIGDAQTKSVTDKVDLDDKLVYSVIKKLNASLQTTLSLARMDKRDTTQLEQEIKLLETLLPKTLSQSEIELFLADKTEDIKKLNEGQALGFAMKAFKSGNLSVDAKDVKEVVLKIKS